VEATVIISRAATPLVGTILLLAACGASAQAPPPGAVPNLGGTSWRLVVFQGSDDRTLTPDDPAKYTIEFNPAGGLIARIDCNRGRGTWESSGPNQLQLGPLALTRAMCPPGSLHDRIVKDWSFVRSYVIRDGRLFLSLMADGGIYEFEPIAEAKAAPVTSPVASTGPIAYECRQTGGGADTLSATFYQTQPAMVLVERGGLTRPAFRVRAASGAKYEGRDLMFWDARGEASVIWAGVELACKRR
jgi:heat shock protein HslJ/membrane-bound inhibitor of C-type lysozyme